MSSDNTKALTSQWLSTKMHVLFEQSPVQVRCLPPNSDIEAQASSIRGPWNLPLPDSF